MCAATRHTRHSRTRHSRHSRKGAGREGGRESSEGAVHGQHAPRQMARVGGRVGWGAQCSCCALCTLHALRSSAILRPAPALLHTALLRPCCSPVERLSNRGASPQCGCTSSRGSSPVHHIMHQHTQQGQLWLRKTCNSALTLCGAREGGRMSHPRGGPDQDRWRALHCRNTPCTSPPPVQWCCRYRRAG